MAIEKDLYVDMIFKSVPSLCIISKRSRAELAVALNLVLYLKSIATGRKIETFQGSVLCPFSWTPHPPPNTHTHTQRTTVIGKM